MTKFETLLLCSGKNDMVAYLKAHPAELTHAIELGLTQQQPLAWRAVWALEEAIVPNDSRVLPYLTQIVGFLPQANDGHARQWLMVLHHMSLPENLLAQLFDWCMRCWCNPQAKPSVRYHAYLSMERIAAPYPELQHEIAATLNDALLDSLSAGSRHSLFKRKQKGAKR